MKRLHIIVVASIVTFGFSALLAVSAYAEATLLAEWLVDGVGVVASVEVLSEGELELEDAKGGLFLENSGVLCSMMEVGTVEPDGKDLLSSITELGNTKTTIKCVQLLNCPEPVEFTPIGLPWTTLLFLMENGEFLDRFSDAGKSIGWTSKCFGINNACSLPEPGLTVLNLPAPNNDVDMLFEESFSCERGGIGQGKLRGEMLVFVDGKTLAASSE